MPSSANVTFGLKKLLSLVMFSLKEWEQPCNVTDIRSFLGLAGYYRRFIDNFSKIAKPMTNLLKKTNEFEWMPKCEHSF
jgi:hypothetical protein